MKGQHGTHRPVLCCGGAATGGGLRSGLLTWEPQRQVKTWSKCLRDHNRDVLGFHDLNA